MKVTFFNIEGTVQCSLTAPLIPDVHARSLGRHERIPSFDAFLPRVYGSHSPTSDWTCHKFCLLKAFLPFAEYQMSSRGVVIYSPYHETLEAMASSGFTAINGRRHTTSGGYDTLPPKNVFTDPDPRDSPEHSEGLFDQLINQFTVPDNAITSHDHPSNTADLVVRSVEAESDTIALRATSDVDDESSLSSFEDANPKYSYKTVKGEAEQMFEKQPDFCVKNSKNETTREVLDVESDTVVTMKFRRWQGQSYGY